jgi:hypothetical protein
MAGTVAGLDIVMARLNAEIIRIENASMKGMIMAAAYIRNETEKTPTVTPVDLGNLKASWFVVTAKSVPVGKSSSFRGGNAGIFSAEHAAAIADGRGEMAAKSMGRMKTLMMGYSANYALWVHEMIGMNPQPGFRYGPGPGRKRRYKPRSGSGPKWFEECIKRNSSKIVQIIRDNSVIR